MEIEVACFSMCLEDLLITGGLAFVVISPSLKGDMFNVSKCSLTWRLVALELGVNFKKSHFCGCIYARQILKSEQYLVLFPL